ncbi:MAG: peptidoglycan-binding protein, partial [Pseudomonadales bacterium]|nr:peptidoglycan-binding protein [Pseudomonadales bacterium]
WQMPPEYRGPSRRGDNDATSAWLAERLALLGGGRADGDGVFDGRLEQRLRAFQIEAGLSPDGIAGPRTWMRLNDRTDIGAPVLVGS